MDLRAYSSAAEAGSSAPVTEASAELEEERDGLLRAGSAIAAEARAAIKVPSMDEAYCNT